MPPNSHGTNGIKINQMIKNDPSFFILNSDEFKKIKAAEVKRPLTMPAGISTESENGNGDSNTISTQKNKYFVVYPSGSRHETTLGLNGILRSSPTTKNCSFGNREQKYDKSEGEKLEDAKTDKHPAVAIRRPTATAKPQVGQKKSAVEFSQLAGNDRNLLSLGISGFGNNRDNFGCSSLHWKNMDIPCKDGRKVGTLGIQAAPEIPKKGICSDFNLTMCSDIESKSRNTSSKQPCEVRSTKSWLRLRNWSTPEKRKLDIHIRSSTIRGKLRELGPSETKKGTEQKGKSASIPEQNAGSL